jgi:hypothetical protein
MPEIVAGVPGLPQVEICQQNWRQNTKQIESEVLRNVAPKGTGAFKSRAFLSL